MFLYRLDTFEGLVAQRRSDPVLRARRYSGCEMGLHTHDQLQLELGNLGKGSGVFRISFWKDWAALCRNVWPYQRGWVIQRVRADHEFFLHLQRDHDQYLKEDAWLMWNALPVVGDEVWSSIGIPHRDIEILHPLGFWLPMDEVQALNTQLLPGWTEEPYDSPLGGRYSLWSKINPIPGDSKGTSIHVTREPYAMVPDGTRKRLIARTVESSASDPRSTRWIHVREAIDHLFAEEYFPVIAAYREPGLLGYWRRWRHPPTEERWVVDYFEESQPLSNPETTDLYVRLGLAESLLRGKAWGYSDQILAKA